MTDPILHPEEQLDENQIIAIRREKLNQLRQARNRLSKRL